MHSENDQNATFNRPIAISLVCAMTLVLMAWILDVGLVDDSYIFLRYARNLAEGNGAVFNVGERVEGYSSPLWTFLLAGFGLVSNRFEVLAYVLGMACGVGSLVLVVFHLRRSPPHRGALESTLLGLGLATCPVLVFWSGSGMDTALFALLVTGALLSIRRDVTGKGMSKRTTVLLLLATLARMEAVLLVMYAGVVLLYRRRSIRNLWVYGVVIAFALAVRYAYYGAWVPNTYHAKVTFGLAQRLSSGIAYLTPAVTANVALLLVVLALLVMARRRTAEDQVTMLLPAGWIVVWCSYVLYVGGDNFALFRFLLPVIPALFLLLGSGWIAVESSLGPQSRRVAFGIVLGAILISNMQTYRAQAEGYYGDMRLAKAWKEVGHWLARETPEDTVIAAIVPGALGYFGQRATIDMLGLTDRRVGVDGDVYAKGGHGHSRYHTDYIYERSPDLVVYHSSGRVKEPTYLDPERIPVRSGYALYDFVTDPRCAGLYQYTSARLANGTLVEMLEKRTDVSAELDILAGTGNH